MEVTIGFCETINSILITERFKALRQKYQKLPKIHLLLDQGFYNTSFETRDADEKDGIVLHQLPVCSANLNPIERLLEGHEGTCVASNLIFRSAKGFKKEIIHLFKITWRQIAKSMTCRIDDNFQILKRTF